MPASRACSSSTRTRRASAWSAPRRTPTPSPTTTRSSPSRTCACPAAQLIGSRRRGMAFAYEWFRFERLMIAARCFGAAERLIDETTAFAKPAHRLRQAPRRQAAGPVHARRQPDRAVRRALMVYGAAQDRRRPRPQGRSTRSAPWSSSMPREMAGRVADRAVQIFGGRGYMRENVAERFFRELRVERIWEGASEIQRVIIADQLAQAGARPARLSSLAPKGWRLVTTASGSIPRAPGPGWSTTRPSSHRATPPSPTRSRRTSPAVASGTPTWSARSSSGTPTSPGCPRRSRSPSC